MSSIRNNRRYGTSFPVSELRKVTLYFMHPERLDGGIILLRDPTVDWMPVAFVDQYIQAKLELHYSPGINPHIEAANQKLSKDDPRYRDPTAARIAKIEVASIEEFVSYWHTTPGLHEKPGVGAPVAIAMSGKTVWMHPDWEGQIEKMENEED